jgi:hypothetical protein
MDRRLYVAGIFFDLTKAYHVINHDILLDKLNHCGIRGVTNLWFKSYLSCVEIVQIDDKNIN